jgi:hypothetical protein
MTQWCQWYVHISWEGEQSQALSMHSNVFSDTAVHTSRRYPFLRDALNSTFYHMELAFVSGVGHTGQLQDFPTEAYIQFINHMSSSRDRVLQCHSLGLIYLLIVNRAESIVTALLERITSGILEHGTLDFNIACGGQYGYVLLAAVSASYLAIARILLEHGADANVINSRKETSLGIAVDEDHIDMVRLLLDHGADVNHESSLRNPPSNMKAVPLILAMGFPTPSSELIRLLLFHGANPNIEFKYDGTPLDIALRNGYQEPAFEETHRLIVQMLLEYGADPNHRSPIGASPAEFAQEKGYHDILQMFAKASLERGTTSSPVPPSSCTVYEDPSGRDDEASGQISRTTHAE